MAAVDIPRPSAPKLVKFFQVSQFQPVTTAVLAHVLRLFTVDIQLCRPPQLGRFNEMIPFAVMRAVTDKMAPCATENRHNW